MFIKLNASHIFGKSVCVLKENSRQSAAPFDKVISSSLGITVLQRA